MSEINYDTLEDRLTALPDDLQIALASGETLKEILAAAHIHGLTSDATDALIEEIGSVLLGETPLSQFSEVLTARLSMSPEQLGPLVNDIISFVFDPIKDLLSNTPVDIAPPTPAEPPYVVPTPPTPPPTPAPADMSASIFEEKLKRVFTMPSSTGNAPSMPSSPGSSAGADPYREPTA